MKNYKDCGQGGKMGHGNMSHWDKTENIKIRAKKARRQQAKQAVREGTE